ncbi:hypothetical protein [Massilia brevitalea]|uniref:hypothetical protein n=1 Tax=Massilia brevitalea TaxID=442526 RepID=UPI002739318A|nr:hypothetical protein [Massilia brevitalea]
MPRLPGQALRLGLGHDSLALIRVGRDATVLAEASLGDVHDPQALRQGLRALLAGTAVAGWPLTVVLADELVRMWQVAPPPAAAHLADLEAAAAMRYQALFGAPPGGWKIAADWQAARPFLAAALPLALLEVLEEAAREARCHLVEIVPQFVAAMNAWRRLHRPGAWFGLMHGQVLTLAAYDGRTLVALRTTVVPPGADRDWLESHVAREALRVGVGRPERVQVCGPAPRSWASHEGRLKFGCTLLDGEGAGGQSGAVRLACTGSPA